MRQTPNLAARDTLKENKSPEESIDHSNPFEIKHVPTNYAIRDTLLVKKPIPITSKKTANPNFLFVTISILLLFLTMLVVLNRSLLANIYRAILSDTFLKSVYRFQNNSQTLSYGLFYLFFILNAGLFLFLLLKQLKVDYFSSDPILFFVCVGIIAAVYLVRHLVLKIIGVIFPVTKEVGYFNFTILAFNIFLGIALLPINGLISFSGDYIATLCLYIGVIIFVILYSIRQLRGMLLAANFLTYQKFHFIIYLCTVEIAPVIILAKLIFTSIGNSI
ncbi:MAG TPA: DUF4271 domain-containing protein [Saprospiraceae bacterium]|nr:DUF4271 domain-containing protein [Saprospiraceae bacterium]